MAPTFDTGACEGYTVVHLAAERGNVAMLRVLIARHADLLPLADRGRFVMEGEVRERLCDSWVGFPLRKQYTRSRVGANKTQGVFPPSSVLCDCA